jgi:hypothetical protein
MAGIVQNSKQEIIRTIQGGITEELVFDKAKHVFTIVNKTASNIYVSLSPSVSDSNFDLVIVPNTQNVFTAIPNSQQIYIYGASTGVVGTSGYQCDDLYPSDLQKVLNTNIQNSTTTSSITSVDGGLVSLGGKADIFSVDYSASKSLISLQKGIVKLLTDLILELNGSNTIGKVDLNTGSNTIGKVDLNTGSNTIGKVDLNTGSNTIGKVDLNTGSNTIGKVDLNTGSNTIGAVGLNAGTNNIGDVDVLTLPAAQDKASTPTIYNVTLTTANTEYSQALPANTKAFTLSIMDGSGTDNYRVAYVTGKVATPTAPYLKFTQDIQYYEDSLYSSSLTLYIASSVAGKIAQLVVWS